MFFGVHAFKDTSCVYVGIDKREDFDDITAPCFDHGPKENGSHVLTKSVEQGKCRVIFQFWIKPPPLPTRIAEKLVTI